MKELNFNKLVLIFITIIMVVLSMLLTYNRAFASNDKKVIPLNNFKGTYVNNAKSNCDVWNLEENYWKTLFNWKYSGSGDFDILNGEEYTTEGADVEEIIYHAKEKKITLEVDCNYSDYEVLLVSSTHPYLPDIKKEIKAYKGWRIIGMLFATASSECEFDNIDLKTQNYDTLLFRRSGSLGEVIQPN